MDKIRLSIKSNLKKKAITLKKKYTISQVLPKDFDLNKKLNQIKEDNFNNRIDKLREDFKEDEKNFNILYPILKLSDPNLSKSETEERNLLISEIFEGIKYKKCFIYFLTFYHINDNILKKLIPSLIYERYEKDKYIFKENDTSEKLYFIFKGNISFIKKENTNEDIPNFEEIEKFVLGEDRYFGETDLIYDKRKRFSAHCISDCHLLTVEKDIFKKLLEEKLSKVETDKKLYLISFFNNFVKMPTVKLERFILNNIETLFFSRNEIIYKEGEENVYLYIIYKGEANLIKNLNEGEFSYIVKQNEPIKYIQKKAKCISYADTIKNKKKEDEEKNNELKLDLLLNKTNYDIVGTLSKGSIGGLEITTGIRKLKYSLISNSNFTCVLKVNLTNINDYLTILMLNLLPLFIKLEKDIYERIKNIKLIDENVLPKSCRKLKKNKTLNKYDNEEEEENDKVYTKQIQKIDDNFQLNYGGFIKMNEYNYNLYQQKMCFKELLKKNQKKIYKINEILKKLDKEQKIKLKYNEVKMSNFLTPKKDNKVNVYSNKKNNTNKKLKRPSSYIFLQNNKKIDFVKFHKLKLSDIDINYKNKYTNNNNLFKKSKSNLNIIKNNDSYKKNMLLNLRDISTDNKFDNIKNNNKLRKKINLEKIRSSIGTENIKNKNGLSFLKQSLDIDDDQYIKNVVICESPKTQSKIKTNELLYVTPKNIKTINLFKSNGTNNKKGDNYLTSYKKQKIIKNDIPKIIKKIIFYDTGKFDIPLLSSIP